MSNFSKNIEHQKERKERNKVRRETLGKFFFDLAKLTFAGLVIGGITPVFSEVQQDGNVTFIILGLVTTIALAWLGDNIIKK